jgi:hypothetical protein
MIQGFNSLLLNPTNVLGQMLSKVNSSTTFTPEWKPVTHINVQYEEDGWVIPVYVRFNSGTVQIIEDGIMTECNHFGAKWGTEEETTIYTNFDGENEHTYELTAYFCDHCPAWSYDQEDWNE